MPDIKALANTIIRGEQAITFPLSIHHGWIHDHKGHHILDIRGWGFIQYHSEVFQDQLGLWVVDTLNAEWDRVNKIQDDNSGTS